jgi:hypothetical protein
MPYQRSYLGQDDDWSWTPEVWEAARIPESPEAPGGEQIWSTTAETKPWEMPSTYPTPIQTDGGWWSGIKDVLVPVSTAAANLIRAMSGQTPPPGMVYDPKTGKMIPASQAGLQYNPRTRQYSQATGLQSWIIPILLLGGGAMLLLRRKR